MKLRRMTWAALSLAAVTLVAGGTGGPLHADDGPAPIDLDRLHYSRVERELLRVDVSHLTPAQRARRTRAIEEFRAYRLRGDFGRATDFPGERVPYFVDSEGRRCAVAHLLHRFGRDELVDEVAGTMNHAFVSDLAGNAELAEWLDSVGITLEEAARIQGPVPMPDPVPETNIEPDEDDEEEVGRAGPVTGGLDSDVPAAGGSSRPQSRTGTGRGFSATAGAGSWWMWWELNKLDYLNRNALRLNVPVTGRRVDEATVQRKAADVRRRRVAPLLVEHLGDSDARVRAAAAIALGRVAGSEAVEHLLPLLEDPQQSVRERVILALGASASSEAADALVQLAERGTLSKKKDQVSPVARSLAIVALGIARDAGLDGEVDAHVARVLEKVKKKDRGDIGVAAALHALLAPSGAVDGELTLMAAREGEPDASRARAVESLGGERDTETLHFLQRLLGGRKVELRRSAAVALARFDSELVAPRLMTAYELEREPLARGFLLLSIAERGGERAAGFLVEQLNDGDRALRPWAALAVGLMARRTRDEALIEALRGAKLPSGERGALWIARGLARDAQAVPAMSDALAKASAPRTRAYAATGLTLVGGDAARFALLERHRTERSELVRAQIANGLGSLGAEEDAGVLLDTLRDVRQPGLQALMAVGVAYHGSESGLDGLLAAAKDAGLSSAARASALDGVGLLLDRRERLAMPRMLRRTNFAVLPGWMRSLFDVTL